MASEPGPQLLTISDLRGGRNNVDPPQTLDDFHVVEALNVDFWNSRCGRKRNGVASTSFTNSGTFAGKISSLFRHVPGTDETLAELWATDDSGTPVVGRLGFTLAWTYPTLKDAPTGNGWDFSYASLNGKLFIAYQSAVNRLHVWDPTSNSVRRTGLAAMGTPSVADTGGGAYAAIKRYYRTRATEQRSSVTVRRSEPSASVGFTPSGAGTAARVTQGTPPSEGETHWEVEVSLDNVTFYLLATVVIGTTTYDDSAATGTYANGTVSALTGTYQLQPSYRSIKTDQGRLLGFGSYTSTDPQNQVQFSGVIGAIPGVFTEETYPLNNYLGLNELGSGAAIGLGGPIDGSFFALKYREVWKLTPTGVPTAPYSALRLSPTVGAVSQQSIQVAEDEVGNAVLTWMSVRGPYRWSNAGIEYIGKGLEDYTIGENGGVSMNLSASHVVCHALWYPNKRQVWFWMATGSSNDPNVVLCFNVGRNSAFGSGYHTTSTPDGWTIFGQSLSNTRCSTLFSNTPGALMSLDLKPYAGFYSGAYVIGKCDTGSSDLGSNYQAYLTTKVFRPWGYEFNGAVMGAQLTAPFVSGGATITGTLVGDYLTSTSDTVSLATVAGESRVQPRFGGAIVQGPIQTFQLTFGDASTTSALWTIDDLTVVWKRGGPIIG